MKASPLNSLNHSFREKGAAFVLLLAVVAAVSHATPQEGEGEVPAATATPTPKPNPKFSADTAEGRLNILASSYWRKITEAREKGRRIIAEFETEAGPICFNFYEVRFGLLKDAANADRVAWIRLAKEDSRENGAAIRAFLSSSRQQKLDAGFKLIESKERPADYGSIRTSLSTRGDEYFKTYLQTTRTSNQDPDGSFHLAYTYYIEMGLTSRRKTFEKQQAASKLGN